jgi:S-adenosylmethionine:tRNA ribosyltransferase-isomerase
MRVEEFDFKISSSLIAQYPSSQRGGSRLLVLHRSGGTIEHREFRDISDYLNPGDLLVINNTRVLPVRLIGKKETGGKCEILLVPLWNGKEGTWEVLMKGSGKLRGKTRVEFGNDISGLIEVHQNERGKISFSHQREVIPILKKIGHVPLPPYIKRKDEMLDRDRYQTIFAEKDGSIAAPTAGLHFTDSLIQCLKTQGVAVASITLHVGTGTFIPVRSKKVEDHVMGEEWVEIKEETSKEIEHTKTMGGRVIAVGTTTTRALESFSNGHRGVRAGKGRTSLFIYPPYPFRVIDGLLTNFHLPKSTLIMLVSAFAGKDLLMKAYGEAIDRKYRFYSYGDAMLIL